MQKSKGNQKVSSQGQRRSKDPQLPVLPKQPTQKQAQKGTLNQSTQKEKAEFSKILQTGQSLNFSEPLKQDALVISLLLWEMELTSITASTVIPTIRSGVNHRTQQKDAFLLITTSIPMLS